MHIKKYSAIPLDTFHIKNKVSNMLKASTALHNSIGQTIPLQQLTVQIG